MRAGWTAIWMPLDLSHLTMDEALASRANIEEVWRWNPASGPQFVSEPATPVQANPAWSVWKRGLPLETTLTAFTPNAAYLVKVKDGVANVNITFRGRPVPPNYPWSTSGVNLVGFATPTTAPVFSSFLSYGAAFATEPTILGYVGGALSSVAPKNPVAVVTSTEPVARGKAYWVQATQFTDYYGPVAVQVAERAGLHFGNSRVSLSIRLKNVVPVAKGQTVVVTLSPIVSVAPPAFRAGTATMGTGANAGRVVSIAPNLNTGQTYATPPTVTISAPSAGTTATATAVLNSAGKIVSFNLTNGGAGYGTTTPTVNVTPTIAGQVPLKIRGNFDPVTNQFAYTSLATSQTVTLAPGQETEVVLVADRAAMGTTAGALFGSILRVTDSLDLTRIDVPVTAVSGDFTGLWTGAAALNRVDQIQAIVIDKTPVNTVVTAIPVEATATVVAGAVTAVNVNSTRAYFTSVPIVGFTGGGGTGATATAVLTKNILTGVTVTAGGSGYATQQVAIANSTFEVPAFGAPGGFVVTPPAATAGWTFEGASGIARELAGPFQQPGPAGPQGAYMAITGSISQALSVPAGTYQISFKAVGPHGKAANGLNVSFNNVLVQTFAPAGFDQGAWRQFSTGNVVVPATGTYTLKFAAVGASGTYVSVDDIVMTNVQPQAPPTVTFTGGQVDVRTTASTMPLRLIVHRAANGAVRLLQQAYVGTDGIATTIATAENLFPPALKPSSRLSSAQFPSDLDILGTGSLSANGTVSFDVTLGYDADTNPFVHRFHPDHDNLNARFESMLPVGETGLSAGAHAESFTVKRAITLTFDPNLPGINDPAWGVTMLGGSYTETVTGLRAVPITVGGTFILYRISDGPTLLPP